MELIADILLVAGALGAGLYCFVLSRRLKRFTDLEKGVGGAVAVLSTQADELKKSLESARDASDQSGANLKELTERAETVAKRLELMMASMHDVELPEKTASKPEASTPVHDSGKTPEEAREITTSNGEDTAEATEQTADPENEAVAPATAKRPGGLMFFRHDRPKSELAR
ncbi:hypothetical protein [Ruegeria sp. SCP11]|uniref:hypothetical protein n=1 Tax=Ruegeria sp. SCP11 TaxID=3141378 RepID=UPI0033390410